MALGSIAEGPAKQRYVELIYQAMPNLLVLFDDPAAKVREALGWLFSRLGEFHHVIFDDPQVVNEVFPRLMKLVLDTSRVSRQACLSFEKIAEANYPTCNEK